MSLVGANRDEWSANADPATIVASSSAVDGASDISRSGDDSHSEDDHPVDHEWDESAPGQWEWIAAIGGLVLVVGLFAVWLTISASDGDDAADAATAAVAIGDEAAIEPLVGGTTQEATTTTEPSTTTTTEPPSTTTSALTPDQLVPVVVGLVTEGQSCGAGITPAAVDVVQLAGGIDVALVRCEAERSRVYEIGLVGDTRELTPLLVEVYDSTGRVVEESADLIGEISIDEVGAITLATDFRVLGDCGVENRTEWNGARFELAAAVGRLDCEATDTFIDQPWPVIFPPTERGPCVPGEATIGEGDVLATQVIDVDGDGALDLLTLTQRGTAGFVRVALATGQVFQAGIGGSTFAADQVAGLRDLDADGFAELFIAAQQGEESVDMVLTRSQCGWVVAGQLSSVNRQVQAPSYRCVNADGVVEILVTTTTAVPDTSPARFLHITERYRLIDGNLAVQRVDRTESETSIIDPLGSACI